MTYPTPDSWRLSLDDADMIVSRALSQRTADRATRTIHDVGWAAIGDEVYGWSGAKTYLAAILCGLVARATDREANPLALQASAPHGYAAASLWKVIFNHSQDAIDLKGLKGVPFNNSPFNGKRTIDASWENVSKTNRPVLARTVEILQAITSMDQEQATRALRGFLYSAPDPMESGDVVADGQNIDVRGLFSALDIFLLDDGENGRRAQAMVAAALAMVHRQDIDTPQSVNDPSRRLAGDVRVIGKRGTRRLALYAEAKQKPVTPEDIWSYVGEIEARDARGTGAYAALVNSRFSSRSNRARELPSWREVLEKRGVLMSIWDEPQRMVRDALIWSGLAIDEAAAVFVELFAHYLAHVEAAPSSVKEWLDLADAFGVSTQND